MKPRFRLSLVIIVCILFVGGLKLISRTQADTLISEKLDAQSVSPDKRRGVNEMIIKRKGEPLPGQVELPEIFGEVPFRIFQNQIGEFYTDLDAGVFDVASREGINYYVDPVNGTLGGDGLTPQSAVDRIGTLFSRWRSAPPQADVVINLADGIYYRNRAFTGLTWNYDVNLTIKAPSEALSTSAAEPGELKWTLEGRAYSAERTAVLHVFDAAKRDDFGIPIKYKLMDSVINCLKTPGSWYTDNSRVWVRTFDDRAPDDKLLVILDTGECTFYPRNSTIYVENVKFIHCTTSTFYKGSPAVNSNEADNGRYIGNNCAYIGSYHNGFAATRVPFVLHYKSVASHCGADGFNYHDNIKAPRMLALEVDCAGYNNGERFQPYGKAKNNGTTAHDGIRVVRVNTVVFDCDGPVLADVNGCFSFNVGVVSRDTKLSSAKTAVAAAFYFDNAVAVSPGEAWLIGCTGDGADTWSISGGDPEVKINIRDWRGSNKINHQRVSLTEY